MSNTHHVFNPTGSPIVVGSNTVPAHSSATIVLSDSDLASFIGSGAKPSLLTSGVATVDQIRGYIKE